MESPNPNIPKILGKNHESTIVVGDFVQVSLSADVRSRKRATFFAEVTEVFQDRSEVALSYIKKSGIFWIWPEEKETSRESMEFIYKA